MKPYYELHGGSTATCVWLWESQLILGILHGIPCLYLRLGWELMIFHLCTLPPEKCAHGIRKYVVKIRFQKCYHFLVLEHVDSSLSAVLSTFPAPKPPRNIVRFDNSLWEEIRLQISSFRPHFYTLRRPGNTRHQEIPTFRPHPLELTHFIKIPSKKHLEAIVFGQRQNIHPWTTLFHHFKRKTQGAQAQASSHTKYSPLLGNLHSTELFYHPPLATFSKQRHWLSPSSADVLHVM